MITNLTTIELYLSLGYDQITAKPSGLFAGFVPDMSATHLRRLDIVSDQIRPQSPLVTKRVIPLTDHQGVTVRIYIYTGSRSGPDVRYAICNKLSGFSRHLHVESGDRLGIRIGDFTALEDDSQGPALLLCGRENVAFLLLDEGTQRVNLVSMARDLDKQLHASPTYDIKQLKEIEPQIDALYINEKHVDTHNSVSLILHSHSPEGHGLHYHFNTTHGAVNRVSNDPPRFMYQAGDASGYETIIASVTSEAGLTATERIELSIGLGDLGYRPGT